MPPYYLAALPRYSAALLTPCYTTYHPALLPGCITVLPWPLRLFSNADFTKTRGEGDRHPSLNTLIRTAFF